MTDTLLTESHAPGALPADAVEQTVALVFQTFLEQEAFPVDAASFEPADQRLTGCVRIQGNARAMILLEANLPVARRLAARFLQADAGEVLEADARDAFGEVTNMIAGNFKSAFFPGAQLDVPPLVVENDEPLGDGQCFVCEDGMFRVALVAA
jgi:CheY-specific phosphatase CheX